MPKHWAFYKIKKKASIHSYQKVSLFKTIKMLLRLYFIQSTDPRMHVIHSVLFFIKLKAQTGFSPHSQTESIHLCFHLQYFRSILFRSQKNNSIYANMLLNAEMKSTKVGYLLFSSGYVWSAWQISRKQNFCWEQNLIRRFVEITWRQCKSQKAGKNAPVRNVLGAGY